MEVAAPEKFKSNRIIIMNYGNEGNSKEMEVNDFKLGTVSQIISK
jgi:hypothetical protein